MKEGGDLAALNLSRQSLVDTSLATSLTDEQARSFGLKDKKHLETFMEQQ